MALNFNFGDTEYFKTEGSICNAEPASDGMYYHVAEIEYVIWASMFVGIGHITEANVDKFIARCIIWEKVHGAFVSRVGEDGKTESAFDADVIRRCIGYRANVSPLTKAQFIANLTRHMGL